MLTLLGPQTTCCDKLPRRSFLKAGFLGLTGTSLAQMLQIRAHAVQASGVPLPKTSVIFLELAGGASQFETYDPKPNAPAEYRGWFGAIPTKLPGVQFSELMPQQAKIADKLAIVRSVYHHLINHDSGAHLTSTGFDVGNTDLNLHPSVGSIATKVRGANAPGLPAYVALPGMPIYARSAYLGNSHDPFHIGNPNDGNFKIKNLTLPDGLTTSRLTDRRTLLKSFDNAKRVLDNHGIASAMDQFTHKAFNMVTNDLARNAFDIGQESPAVRDMYGRNSYGQSVLLARRLVEAGVTFITVTEGSWDFHDNAKSASLHKSPSYDRAVAALVNDLQARGLDRDVLVVAMGEFGRTPKINKLNGRDHWPQVMSVLFAGGGLQMGQVIGASNAKGEEPIDAPYKPQSVLAMVYRHLGIDPAMTFDDLTGRPRHILDHRTLIKELI